MIAKAKVYRWWTVWLVLFLGLNSCQKNKDVDYHEFSRPAVSYNADFVHSYMDLICKVVQNTPGFFPPQASRAYGLVSLALYEAVVPGINPHNTLEGQINGLMAGSLPKPTGNVSYNWAIAANAAIAEMMRKMFEITITNESLQEINDREKQNRQRLSQVVPQEVSARSEAYGLAIAAALYQYSINDGGHQSQLNPFQLPYVLPTGPGMWVPTGAALTPLAPHWGENRPFLTANIKNTEPPPCYPFNTDPHSDLYQDALQVNNQVAHNTPEQIDIVNYWNDNPFTTCTPTGHTFNILAQLLEETHATLAKTAVAYALLGIAEHDAFIACWKCKYKYNLLRPVTYIRRYINPEFSTVISTPPFPSYVSGHSDEIAAGSRIFTVLFTKGDGKYKLTDHSQNQYGFSSRTFNSFDEMALECANSRFYGGIHYIQDNVFGLEQGKKIGNNVISLIRYPAHIR